MLHYGSFTVDFIQIDNFSLAPGCRSTIYQIRYLFKYTILNSSKASHIRTPDFFPEDLNLQIFRSRANKFSFSAFWEFAILLVFRCIALWADYREKNVSYDTAVWCRNLLPDFYLLYTLFCTRNLYSNIKILTRSLLFYFIVFNILTKLLYIFDISFV